MPLTPGPGLCCPWPVTLPRTRRPRAPGELVVTKAWFSSVLHETHDPLFVSVPNAGPGVPTVTVHNTTDKKSKCFLVFP